MRRSALLTLAIALSGCVSAFGTDGSKPLKVKPRPSGDRTQAEKADRLTGAQDPLPDSGVIQPLKQHFEYVLPGSCVSSVSAGPEFKCVGSDKDHLVCSGMVVTVQGKVDDCLQINVVKDK